MPIRPTRGSNKQEAAFSLFSSNPITSLSSQKDTTLTVVLSKIIIMPRATARVGQVVVAETEQWEFVEDNVYVC